MLDLEFLEGINGVGGVMKRIFFAAVFVLAALPLMATSVVFVSNERSVHKFGYPVKNAA